MIDIKDSPVAESSTSTSPVSGASSKPDSPSQHIAANTMRKTSVDVAGQHVEDALTATDSESAAAAVDETENPEYTAMMGAIDDLQNVLFEEEMQRLESARRLEEKETLVQEQMRQLQELTDMMDTYDDELHMMQKQLEDLLVMKQNMREELKTKETQSAGDQHANQDLNALLMSRDLHLAEMNMLVKQLEADPNFELMPEKPAKAPARGFLRSLIGAQQVAGQEQ